MARTIDPGRFRHRVQIRSNVPVEDDTGQGIPSYSLQATVWGAIDPVRGIERFEALKITPTVTHRITIRDYALLNQHQLREADLFVEYEIDSIIRLDDQGKRYLEVWCKETLNE